MLSENINSIYTFSDGNTEIIVILQNATRSLIYSMNYDRLRKIQILKDVDLCYAAKYEFNKNTYLVVFNRQYHSTVYKWKGKTL